MLKKGILVIALIAASQGLCFGQGFLDSVFGPGGLGIWGGDSSNLTNQQFPGAQPQQQQVYPGQQAPYPGGYPQNPYYNQQGVYSDWQNYPPATIGGGQDQYPQQYQAPQQQYQTPQYSNQPQGVPPQMPPQQVAPQQQPVRAQMQQQPMPPQQYPPGPPQVSAEDLPAGAVRMTTTTPDGTTVQYYPPEGEPMQVPGVAPATPQQPRRLRAKPATPKQQTGPRATQAREKTGAAPAGGIAMPKPVEVPQGDPRYGWGSAPAAPEVR